MKENLNNFNELAPEFEQAYNYYKLAIRRANLPGNIPCERVIEIKEKQNKIEQKMVAASDEVKKQAKWLPTTLLHTNQERAAKRTLTNKKTNI